MVKPRTPAKIMSDRGYRKHFLQSVTQADEGVDFDFLQPAQRARRIPGG